MGLGCLGLRLYASVVECFVPFALLDILIKTNFSFLKNKQKFGFKSSATNRSLFAPILDSIFFIFSH